MMIHIAGLGPGDPGSITLDTLELLRTTRVVLRTRIHPTVETLARWDIAWESLDEIYETRETFADVYQALARAVLERFRAGEGDLCYCVPGNPMIAERSVTELIALLEAEGIPFRVHPAVSFLDTILDVLQRDPIQGLLVLDAADLASHGLQSGIDTVITQVYNQRVASDTKLALGEFLDDEAEIVYVRNAGIPGQESLRRIPLWALDRQEDVDHLTTVFIERETIKPGFRDFCRTIDALREPGGCPWDREQTHESLRRYLIEEAYEAADAITEGDMDDVLEELGDVLLQVVLHARIASENGDFTIGDIIRRVNDKMITRHPHVFGDLDLASSAAVLTNWEKIKKTEKGETSLADKLRGLPKSIPSTMRAAEVAKKAAAYGVAPRAEDPLLAGLRELVADGGPTSAEELADLIYLAVLLADQRGHQPETLLNARVDEEIRRLAEIDDL